jgi:hypothetical protein
LHCQVLPGEEKGDTFRQRQLSLTYGQSPYSLVAELQLEEQEQEQEQAEKLRKENEMQLRKKSS